MGAYCLLIRNVRRRIEFTSYRQYDTGSKISHYRDLTVEDVPWPGVSDQTVYTRAYHRPLSWYVRALRTAGLVVTALEEPEPTEEFLASRRKDPGLPKFQSIVSSKPGSPCSPCSAKIPQPSTLRTFGRPWRQQSSVSSQSECDIIRIDSIEQLDNMLISLRAGQGTLNERKTFY